MRVLNTSTCRQAVRTWSGPWVLGPGSWVLGPGSWVLGPGSWVLGPGSLNFSTPLKPPSGLNPRCCTWLSRALCPMPAAMTGTAPAAGSPAGDRGFLNAAARACPASGSSCQADGYPVCPGNHLGSSPGRRGLPARRRRGLFAVPDLAIGDDRHLAPYVRCVRRCVHVGLAGDFDEARQQLFGPPYQMDVTALGPGDDGRIRVHVGEQQNRHEVGWLLSVPRYGPLWGRDIVPALPESCLVAVLTRPSGSAPWG